MNIGESLNMYIAEMGTNSDNIRRKNEVEDENIVLKDINEDNMEEPRVPLKHSKKMLDPTKEQFIEFLDTQSNGLPYCARLKVGCIDWELHGHSSIVIVDGRFNFKVSIESNDELNDATDFNVAKNVLFKHLKIDDKSIAWHIKTINDTANSIQIQIKNLFKNSGTNSAAVSFLLELDEILKSHSYQITINSCNELQSNKLIVDDTLKANFSVYAGLSLFMENLRYRIKVENQIHSTSFLQKSFTEIWEQYMELIYEHCSPQLCKIIDSCELSKRLLLNLDDVKFLGYLEALLIDTKLEAVLPNIVNNTFKKINAFGFRDNKQHLDISLYFDVHRSLLKMVKRAEKIFETTVIEYKEDKWHMMPSTKYLTKTAVERCLIKQIQMLVDFTNHDDIRSYPYKFQILHLEHHHFNANEQHVWLYLMDATIMDILQKDTNRIRDYRNVYNTLQKCLLLFGKSQEHARIVTHTSLEFLAEIEMSRKVWNSNNDQIKIVEHQIFIINEVCSSDRIEFSKFQAIMNVFQSYWKNFSDPFYQLLLDPVVDDIFHTRDIQITLFDIALEALSKRVESDKIIMFFNAFNRFLNRLGEIPFNWYVRISDDSTRVKLYETNVMKAVQNHEGQKLDCSFVPRDRYKHFAQILTDGSLPKHYQFEIVRAYLKCVENMLARKLNISSELALNASAEIMNIITTSYLHFEDQPYCSNFSIYYETIIRLLKSDINSPESIDQLLEKL